MTSQTTYQTRLRRAISAHEIYGAYAGLKRLAADTGLARERISMTLNGGSSQLMATAHVRVCAALGISPFWLSEGEGPMRGMVKLDPVTGQYTYDNVLIETERLEQDEQSLLDAYRSADPPMRGALLQSVQAICKAGPAHPDGGHVRKKH